MGKVARVHWLVDQRGGKRIARCGRDCSGHLYATVSLSVVTCQLCLGDVLREVVP
jgi:hypothetical protein